MRRPGLILKRVGKSSIISSCSLTPSATSLLQQGHRWGSIHGRDMDGFVVVYLSLVLSVFFRLALKLKEEGKSSDTWGWLWTTSASIIKLSFPAFFFFQLILWHLVYCLLPIDTLAVYWPTCRWLPVAIGYRQQHTKVKRIYTRYKTQSHIRCEMHHINE